MMSAAQTASGIWATPQATTVKWGDMGFGYAVLNLLTTRATANTSASISISGNVIPGANDDDAEAIIVIDDTDIFPGYVKIDTTGAITISKAQGGGTFSGIGDSGFGGTTIFYRTTG
jgi:hypothetical protein